MSNNTQYATFAGGCFWCTEHAFMDRAGVLSVTSGYTGGDVDDPTYHDVCEGDTGHAEAVRVEFDPAGITYPELLDIFWRSIDPTDEGGQFADRGDQYRSVIFYHSEEQRREAEASRNAINVSGRLKKTVATAIEPAPKFYPAEEYHQKYCRKNPLHFRMYHNGSGRAACLANWWKE